MLGSINVLPGTDLTTGAIVLTVFLAGAAIAIIAAFGFVAFRRAGDAGMSGMMWRGGLVLVGVLLTWALLDRSSIRDQIVERRALEARAADLTIRAIQPGSALACLDAVAGPAVEAACEKSLFASPEMIAAAVAYIDARVSLLSAGAGLADRDQAYRPSFERLRRALEVDRFGLVSHVLMTRGCTGTDCPDLKLVRDSSRILSGMRSRTFDAHVSIHSLAWNPGAVAVSSAASGTPVQPGQPQIVIQQAPAAMNQPSAAAAEVAPQAPAVAGIPQATTGAAAPLPKSDPTLASGTIMPAQPLPQTAGSTAGHPKFDFPSSASIPAVSILAPEPTGPPAAAEAKPAAKRPAQSQAQRHPAPRQAPPQPQPGGPTLQQPQAAPPAPPQQTSGQR
jgi:hypothetical protein